MPNIAGKLNLTTPSDEVIALDIKEMRDIWYETSFLLDQKQTANNLAKDRFDKYKAHPLTFKFPEHFTGDLPTVGAKKPIAAIVREKGSNSEREMANAMYLAGFDVKDVHMTDLISGREDLSDVNYIVYVGGFSNSDVLGSAKGWAGTSKSSRVGSGSTTGEGRPNCSTSPPTRIGPDASEEERRRAAEL